MQHVKVGDLDVGYRTIGPFGAAADSTPLLMIMGSSGTMDLWSPQFVETLAQGREVVVFDNRGMGRPTTRAARMSSRSSRTTPPGSIKALGFDQMDVLGWSMGGDVALDLTVHYPKLVRRLVSYAGDAGGEHAVPMSKKTLAVLMDTSGTAEQRGMRLLTLLFPPAYREANPAYAESFPIPQEQAAPAAIALQDRAIGAWKGVWSGLKSISCPTLFVTGAEDVIAPAQNAKLMAEVVPGAELEVVPGRGARSDVPGPAEAGRRGDGLPRPVSRATYTRRDSDPPGDTACPRTTTSRRRSRRRTFRNTPTRASASRCTCRSASRSSRRPSTRWRA